jgi:hypothetical protein
MPQKNGGHFRLKEDSILQKGGDFTLPLFYLAINYCDMDANTVYITPPLIP